MRIEEIIAGADGPIFSFEFFPPKSDEGEANLRAALAQLKELCPDFASVTYGAGGATRGRTLEITKWLKADLEIETMAHLTCVGHSVAELERIIDDLVEAGVENIMALRGDPPRGQLEWRPHPQGLHHATELVELIRGRHPQIGIGVAAFPEVHPEASDPLSDLQHLKRKVDAGADFAVTQMFFDNAAYFHFVDAARFAGVDAPILPGLMPITNYAQIKRITELSGRPLPGRLESELANRADSAEAVADLGVSYATLQAAELLDGGAPGVHFITMNRSPATRAILTALKLMDPTASRKPVGS